LIHPDPHQKRLLTDADPIPPDLVGRLAHAAIDHQEQFTCDPRPAGEALWPLVEDRAATDRAARTAAAEFEATAASRDWTVPGARVQQLAADAIGLDVEGYLYDYDREQARAAAVQECLEGEAARAEVPLLERHAEAFAEPVSPDVAGFARLGERAERVRGGGER
jgi:hypothetical protein